MGEVRFYMGKCPGCKDGMMAMDTPESNFVYCVECGCVVYKERKRCL